MKQFTRLISMAFMLASVPVHSHDHGHSHGHSHSYEKIVTNPKKLEKNGRDRIKKLINDKKIHASWAQATYEKAEKKKFGKKMEWVATFVNKKGVKGKKLYVFFKMNGEVIAANFKGK